ncbi:MULTISPECIES: hypothetical protein [Pantoea]|jgi:hypothetical protein|uniref:Uncharacterized protein n=1 Tax=Pantoea brenneri TaxID=472694 RepID=A0A7Y6NH26_9GAMM|nr:MULTISPECIES: hypothetical protein [Pantoea]MBZ6397004.1 hypothetical protein [Pantoea sp.]MBZ6440245.1 hypothetical protein [Pantoea sp.]NUY43491.1 hypothetical protein [Pantoea brenneri]NUY50943.1 hypothetical protein [Pantoea brenneri]NUY61326.1 hypothetical protein [Pantoea brenneri]
MHVIDILIAMQHGETDERYLAVWMNDAVTGPLGGGRVSSCYSWLMRWEES